MAYLDDLRDMISQVHGADATHVESVPVKKTFQGKTVWEHYLVAVGFQFGSQAQQKMWRRRSEFSFHSCESLLGHDVRLNQSFDSCRDFADLFFPGPVGCHEQRR